ncbi:transglycosylase family protein [Egicoccus sp. AB-alg6-2]|uniref:transglycosylase family protein n=1 Tax=Egicoccus sp. AB-alg6-2 TaxID=3242692 RepID=UPI00359D8B66
MLLRCARFTFTLALAAALVATTAFTATPSAEAAEFSDTSGRGYADAVDALAQRGIVQGDRNGHFNPEHELTRGQMASILAAALELPAPADTPFTDAVDHPHADGIAALEAAGVVNGCDTARFCPDEPISRAALATMLANGFEVPATDARHFDDGGGVHEEAIHALAEAGIAAGCTAPVSGFCPTGQVLRWQVAYFVARALDLVDRVEIAPLAERQQLERERQERLAAERAAQQKAEEEARIQAARNERDAMWDRLAQCESGGNWSINTGNGYYGGLQFTLSSWRAVGGSGYPHHHSRAEQINRGERLLAIQGWGAWPACSRKLGYR